MVFWLLLGFFAGLAAGLVALPMVLVWILKRKARQFGKALAAQIAKLPLTAQR
jgi:hypothetical protein